MSQREPPRARWLRRRFNPNGAPFTIPGFKRRHFDRMLRWLGCRTGAEIGVDQGKHSVSMLRANPRLELLCVDPWVEYREGGRVHTQALRDRSFETATRALAGRPAKIIRLSSAAAAATVPLESLDFVYVDAAHDFDNCMIDLIEWARRVRPGGVVSGHDYYRFRWAGVVDAVNAYTAAHKVRQWYLADDAEKTFFWVKQ